MTGVFVVSRMSPLTILRGQYHWVSELAPSRMQKGLSYAVGKAYCNRKPVRTELKSRRMVDRPRLADLPVQRLL